MKRWTSGLVVLALAMNAAAQTPDAAPPTGAFPAESATPAPAEPPAQPPAEPPAAPTAAPESAPIPLPAAPPPPPPLPAAPPPPAVQTLPQLDRYAVVLRLRVDQHVDLSLTHRKRKQPNYEFARCRGSCDIAIRPGRYTLEVGDGRDTRAGVMSVDVARSGTYRLTPAARDTLLPGVLLSALGPAVMGAGIGIVAGDLADERDGPLYWGGAGMFAAGAVLTGAGWTLYADRPRITFEPGDVPRERAVEAYPTVVPSERELSYEEGRPIPPGYRLRREPRRGMLGAGMMIFGISYAVMAGIGAAALTDDDESDEYERLLIPVAGPLFIPREDGETSGWILFGAAPQAAGLALMIAGMASERVTLVPDAKVSVSPVLAPGTAGVVVGGQL